MTTPGRQQTRNARRQTFDPRAMGQPLGGLSNSQLNSRNAGRLSFSGASRKLSIGGEMGRNSSHSLGRNSSHSLGLGSAVKQRKSSASRRSSAFGGRGIVDPRPNDKQYQSNAMNVVLNYLLDNGYDQQIAGAGPKWRPSMKEFQSIVCFLIKQLDPSWKQKSAKFEDEYIAFLKSFKYPFAPFITKTTLSSVGSEHSWSHLLRSLEWQVELLNYDKEVTRTGGHAKQAFGANVEDLRRELVLTFLNYTKVAYEGYMAFEDEAVEALENEYKAANVKMIAEAQELVRTAEDEQQRLITEIETELQTGASVPAKKNKLTILHNDIAKFDAFSVRLADFKKELEENVAGKRAELTRGKEELTKCEQRVESLKERVATQELSADEARRMVQERTRLETTLSKMTEYHQKMNQKAWENEMARNSKVEELERVLHNYFTLGASLQLLSKSPSSPPRNAKGTDFRILVNEGHIQKAASVSDVLLTDPAEIIMPALKVKKDMVIGRAAAMRDEANELQDMEEQAKEALEEASDRFRAQEARHVKLEEQLRREKEDLEAVLSEREKEQRDIEAEVELLHDNPAERERRRCDSQKRIAELRSQQQALAEKQAREATEARDQIMMALQQLADFKEHTSSCFAELNAALKQKVDAMQNL